MYFETCFINVIIIRNWQLENLLIYKFSNELKLKKEIMRIHHKGLSPWAGLCLTCLIFSCACCGTMAPKSRITVPNQGEIGYLKSGLEILYDFYIFKFTFQKILSIFKRGGVFGPRTSVWDESSGTKIRIDQGCCVQDQQEFSVNSF